MKKILSLLALLMLCIVGANAETVAKYALSVDDTFTSGQTVEVKNGDAVVATITYGETGGADFKAAKSYTGIEGYTAFTEGNGVNGNKEGGTFYTITPKIDATISVAVCLNADKAFYIEEDGTALEDYNGIKVSAKFYGTYEFEATADKAYKVYCAGSKLGFFGFEVITPDVYTVAGNAQFLGEWQILEANDLVKGEDGIYTKTFEGVELENDYEVEYKIVKNHSWDESYGDNGNNAKYKVWEGTGVYDVTFTFNAETKAVSCAMEKQAVDLSEYENALQALIDQVESFGLELLAEDVATAKDALTAEDRTAESLTAATEALKANVIAKLLEALDLAEQFGNDFGYPEISNLVPSAKTMVQSWNVTMIKMLMSQMGPTATEKVQEALGKIEGYAETIDNEAFNAALAEAQAAVEGTDYFLMIQKLEVAANAFLVASQEFVAKVQTIENKTEELETALAAAVAAMGAEKPNIVTIGEAIQELVKAYRAFEEANQLVIESMTIVGDFLGFETEEENFNPANGWAMIQDADNPAIWTLTKENVVVEAKQYNYKATANGVYGVYELPAQGNHNWVFGSDEYPAGTYNLTFTADTEKHDLTLVVDKQAEATEFLILTLDGRADITEGKALLVEATEEVSANIWIKKEAAGARGIAKVPAAEIMEDGIAMLLIEDADLTSGQFSIYADKQFEIAKVTLLPNPDAATGEQIYPVVEPVDPFADITIDPAVGEVANLQEFTLTFTNAANAQGAYYDDSDKPYVVSADNSFVEYGEFDYGQGFNEVVVRLGSAVTTAGEYTLVIPAGTITADDATNAEDLKFNYTVKGEKQFNVYVVNVPEGFGTPWAYAWSGDGDAAVPVKAWPGDKMGISEMNDDMTVVTKWVFQVTAAEAPEHVIFNNGNLEAMVQTDDLDFEDGKVYDLSELLGITPADPFENVIIDPAEGEVASLQEFTLKFEGAENVQVFYNEDVEKPYLVNADNENQIVWGSINFGFETDEAVVTLEEEVAVAGNYTLVIPAGIIEINEVANAEMKFNYTVKGEKQFNVYVVNVPEGFGTPWAYAWSGDGDAAVPVKAWPGDKMGISEMNDDMTVVTKWVFQVTAAEAPEHVIFNNGNLEAMVQTDDLDFEDGKVYDLSELLGITPADPFENVTIDPAEGEVASLQEFTITFANAENAYGAYFDEADMPYLVNADNTQVFYGEFGYGFDGYNQVTVTLREEVTLAGEYTLVIPAGTITADDATNTEALTFSYTIAEGEKEFSVYVVNVPEDFGAARPFAYVWSGEGDNVTEFAGAWPGTRMGYSDVPGYSDMGFVWQITAKVAPEFIVFSNGKNSTDEGAKQTKDLEFVPNKVYDLTELLATSTGIYAINAAIADGATVYNMQGVRVDKATKKGLYIVNGKKVVMK